MGIGYVPEHRAIFRNLTVAENLKIAERKKGDLERKSDFIFGLFPDLKRLYQTARQSPVRRAAANAGRGARPGGG